MNERDVKLLWGRSAGHCAKCGCKLSFDSETATDTFPLGEHAHIVGEKTSSPRGVSSLTDKERDGYANRILLCPNDHTQVDKDVTSWPVERLHQLKSQHELRIEETLSTEKTVRQEAEILIYSHAVDGAVELGGLDQWTDWVSSVLEPQWVMRLDRVDAIERFRELVFRLEWPGRYPDLEVALDRLSFELQELAASVSARADLEGDWLRVRRHYKEVMHPQHVYRELEDGFFDWSYACERRIMEASKAANWMREIWRREANPMFFATEGRFVVTLWPDESFRWTNLIPLYTEEEKADLLRRGINAGDIRPPGARPRD